MDGKRVALGRRIGRRFEGSRVEDQVWALAYEQVWPVLRTIVNKIQLMPHHKARAGVRGKASIARRA